MSIDVEMSASNDPTTSLPTPTPTFTAKPLRKDYSLPSSFFTLLTRPVKTVIDELIPKPKSPPIPSPAQVAKTSAESFLGAFRKNADALTENDGQAHSTTQSALVELFFDMAPPVNVDHIRELLDKAYKEDPLNTTRLIFQTRSIHEGKGFKEGFWVAAGWLWANHPKTFLANLHLLVDPTCKRERSKERDEKKAALKPVSVETLDEDGEIEKNLEALPEYPARPHGTFDDLIDLLVLHINGQLNDSTTEIPDAIDEGIAPAFAKNSFRNARLKKKSSPTDKRDRLGFAIIGKDAIKKAPGSFRHKLAQCGSKAEKHSLFCKRLETSLTSDSRFQALYCTVVDIFVIQLRADLSLLDKHKDFVNGNPASRKPFLDASSPHLFGMSYGAKWVPSLGKSADKQLHIASAIAMLLFPGEGVDKSRDRLQKDVLGPLRQVLKVPEVNMGEGAWKVDYTKVPSRAMARYATAFVQHDPKGFEAYITKVAKGKLSISGASLFPHEILIDATSAKDKIIVSMADLQWKTLVESLKSSSSCQLKNCLAVADVSGSMGSYGDTDKKNPTPMTVCLALTLLLGEVAAAPWNGLFFTFSSDPSAQYIDPSLSLSERAATLSRAKWSMSTNFYKVFNLILTTAQNGKLDPANMVQKLFIFSDMQFNQCAERKDGDTEYTAIKRKFTDAGYTLPELVFWNLAPRATGAPKPVRADQEGVSLLSGFSGSMMKYFLGEAAKEEDEELSKAMAADWEAVEADDDGDIEVMAAKRLEKKEPGEKKKDDPITTVRKILGAESFKGVVVID